MPVKQLEANIRQETDLAIIVLNGEIDGFAEDTLDKAYQEAESTEPQTILLNFSDVNYINSTGIALIVSLLARARKEHRRLAISNLSDHYREIFQITRLADFMSIYPDEKTAREALLKTE
jgi:anti-sigma B factor antagonist